MFIQSTVGGLLTDAPPSRPRRCRSSRCRAARGRDARGRGGPAARARAPAPPAAGSAGGVPARRGIGPAAWARLARRAQAAHAALLVVLDERSPHAPGPFAHASLEVRPAAP